MAKSLQEQLLGAGLVDNKKAKAIKQQQRKQKKKQPKGHQQVDANQEGYIMKRTLPLLALLSLLACPLLGQTFPKISEIAISMIFDNFKCYCLTIWNIIEHFREDKDITFFYCCDLHNYSLITQFESVGG